MRSVKKRSERVPVMQATKPARERFGKLAAGALLLALFCLLVGACSSGPKVINLGDSASRVTIETR